MAVLSMFRRFFIVFCYQGPAISRLIANISNLVSVLEVFWDFLPRPPWKFSIGHILLHLERSLYFYKWQCIYALPWGRCYNIYEDNVYRHYSSLKNWKGHTWSYTYSNILLPYPQMYLMKPLKNMNSWFTRGSWTPNLLIMHKHNPWEMFIF